MCGLALKTERFSIDQVSDIKNILDIALTEYDISKIQTSLIPYEGDVNEQLLKKFILCKKVEGCSDRTLDFYLKTMKHVCSEVAKPVHDWTTDDIRKYLAIRQIRDNVSDVTRDNERRNISAFFCWAVKEEILPKNIMLRIPHIKCHKTSRKAFTEMEVEKIRNYAQVDERIAAIVETLFSTGCRVSELVNIRLQEIDGNTITVHGKGNKDRTVYLNAKAQLAIEKYVEKRKDDNQYLFPRMGNVIKGRGTKIWWTLSSNIDPKEHMDKSSVEGMVRKIGNKLGIKAHPHKFRRTCATMALRKGMPIAYVSKMLGHASVVTTQIYLDLSDDELDQFHRKYVN